MSTTNCIALKYPHGNEPHGARDHRLTTHCTLEHANNNVRSSASGRDCALSSTIVRNSTPYCLVCLERRDGIFKLHSFVIVATSSASSTRDGVASNRAHQQQQ